MKKTKFIFLIVCAFRLYDINAMDTGSDKNLIVEILKKNFENSEKRFYYESQASEVLQTNAAPLILSKEKKIILFDNKASIMHSLESKNDKLLLSFIDKFKDEDSLYLLQEKVVIPKQNEINNIRKDILELNKKLMIQLLENDNMITINFDQSPVADSKTLLTLDYEKNNFSYVKNSMFFLQNGKCANRLLFNLEELLKHDESADKTTSLFDTITLCLSHQNEKIVKENMQALFQSAFQIVEKMKKDIEKMQIIDQKDVAGITNNTYEITNNLPSKKTFHCNNLLGELYAIHLYPLIVTLMLCFDTQVVSNKRNISIDIYGEYIEECIKSLDRQERKILISQYDRLITEKNLEDLKKEINENRDFIDTVIRFHSLKNNDFEELGKSYAIMEDIFTKLQLIKQQQDIQPLSDFKKNLEGIQKVKKDLDTEREKISRYEIVHKNQLENYFKKSFLKKWFLFPNDTIRSKRVATLLTGSLLLIGGVMGMKKLKVRFAI